MEGSMIRATIGGAMFFLLCAGVTRVDAQGVASSFDQLSVLVKPGDTLRVDSSCAGAEKKKHRAPNRRADHAALH